MSTILHWADWQVLDHRLGEHRRALRNEGVLSSLLVEQVFVSHHQMDLSKVIDAHLHTHRPIACWSPVISNMSRPLSIGEGAQCQESIPPYWTGITLNLLLFDFTNLSLYRLRYNVLLTCASYFPPFSCFIVFHLTYHYLSAFYTYIVVLVSLREPFSCQLAFTSKSNSA